MSIFIYNKLKINLLNLNLIIMKLKMINGGGYSAPKIYEYAYAVESGFQTSLDPTFEDLDFIEKEEL